MARTTLRKNIEKERIILETTVAEKVLAIMVTNNENHSLLGQTAVLKAHKALGMMRKNLKI